MAFTIQVPRANPFRIVGNDKYLDSIDYVNVMPRFDIMKIEQQYIKGEYVVDGLRPDWLINTEIKMQIRSDTSSIVARLHNSSGFVLLTVVNITPAGWVGYDIWKITGTPTTNGIHYITIGVEQDDPLIPDDTTDINFITDTFNVSGSLPTDKDLIRLDFKNTSNKFGFVFDDYYTAFYTSVYEEADDEQENTVTKTDTGTSKQNSINYPGIDVVFTDIQKRYKSVINNQLQCDTLIFNGMNCVCEEAPEGENIENSTAININAKLLFAGGNDYMGIF